MPLVIIQKQYDISLFDADSLGLIISSIEPGIEKYVEVQDRAWRVSNRAISTSHTGGQRLFFKEAAKF